MYLHKHQVGFTKYFPLALHLTVTWHSIIGTTLQINLITLRSRTEVLSGLKIFDSEVKCRFCLIDRRMLPYSIFFLMNGIFAIEIIRDFTVI